MEIYRNITKNGSEISGEESYDGVHWSKFIGDENVMKVRYYAGHKILGKKIWELQDGYGESGHTPCQGWDWSGIRDSSDETWKLMTELVIKYHGNKPWPWDVNN